MRYRQISETGHDSNALSSTAVSRHARPRSQPQKPAAAVDREGAAQRFHGLALLLRALDTTAHGEFATGKDAVEKAASFPVLLEELARETVVDALGRRFCELVSTGSAATGDPRPRRDALDAALTLSAQYALLAGKPTDPTPEALQTRLDLVKKEVEAAEKRAAVLAAQEEAKRKREEGSCRGEAGAGRGATARLESGGRRRLGPGGIVRVR